MQRSGFLVGLVLMGLMVGILLGGCGKKSAAPESTAADTGLGEAESLETAPPPPLENISEGRTSGPMLPVYFAFDSSVIEEDQQGRMEKNSDFLREHPEIKVRVEGNCDPRGTNEYNLALGERRAQSAVRYLVNLGIDPARLSTVSWGEEKLLLYGHDELSWAQNRRVDFVIVK